MSDRATKVKIENQLSQTINPATEEKQDDIVTAIQNITIPAPVGGATESTLSDLNSTSYWLKTLIRLLKPLSIVTGAGSNRISVDVNAVTGAVSTVTTVTTVTTVASMTNQVNMGNVAGFTMQQALLRNAFANGIRKNLV